MYPLNRNGMVVLSKGDQTYESHPESVEVWLEDGWTVADDDKEGSVEDVTT